jgi:FMN-dependent NADH-azoreductase
VADPPPHLSPAFVASMFSDKTDGVDFALSNQLIAELFESDTIVIEAPMYNFGVPSVLKAWIDHVVRARKTFRNTDKGVEGLLKGKKTILILGSGYFYTEGPFKAMDFHETYLRATLGFMGLTDIQNIRIERLNMGPENAAAALAQAKQRVSELLQ